MRLRNFLIIIGLIGLGLLVLGAFGNLDKLVLALRDMRWYLIPLLVITQIISFYCNARFYHAFFGVYGEDVSVKLLYKSALAINFANNAIPAGGVAGTSFLTQAVGGQISAGRATMAQIGRYAFNFISFFPVLVTGFLLLFWGGGISRVSVRFIVLVLMLVLFIGLLVAIYFSDRKRLQRAAKPFARGINSIWQNLFRQKTDLVPADRLDYFLDELFDGYREIIKKRGSWVGLFGWALGGNVAEIATLYAVFLGFGIVLNPGVVIAAYTIALGTSLLSFVTSGIGAYEAGMIGALTALTIPFATAFAVVIVYRALSMLIFLPVGFYYYRKILKT